MTPDACRRAYWSQFRDASGNEGLGRNRIALNQELVSGNNRFKAQVESLATRAVSPGNADWPRLANDEKLCKGELCTAPAF